MGILSEEGIKDLEDKLEIQFSIEEQKQLKEQVSRVTLPKGCLVLKEGDIARNLYFILKGLVRGYYIDENGEEITKCFCSEGHFFSSEGFRKGECSSFYIETLEACRCMTFPYEMICEWMSTSKELYSAIQKLLFREIERLELRTKEMLTMDAEARYLKFQKDYPGLNDRIKKQYIASYIGIKPGSLSRIIKSFKN